MTRPDRRKSALLATATLAGLMGATPLSIAHAQAAITASQAAINAQEGQIAGQVVDAGGNYVVGAEVQLEGSDRVEVTDSNGRFTLRRAPAGSRTVNVTYFGAPKTSQAVTVTAGATAEVTIRLNTTGDVSELVVTASRPIAESEAAAIQLQRSSTSLVSVVAADSIGRFPDQNIAAALSRLPGIAVQRDQGQERFVNLRGSPPQWTTIAFDGVNVVSPGGRVARLDTIPSAIASKVIVRKAVTAEMPGETVAGNINIVTRSAFDYPGFKMAADLGLGYNELGQGVQYNAGGFLADRFANDKLGLVVSASRYERDMVTDNFEQSFEVAPEDREPGGANRIWASQTQNKLYRLTRTNTAFSGRLDWEPNQNHRVFLSSIFTEFTDDELRSQYIFDFDQNAVPTTDTRPQATAQRTGYADVRTGNTPLKGTIYGVEIDSTLNSNAARQRIFTNTFGGHHDLDNWTADWRLNYTRADDISEGPFGSTWVGPSNRTLRPSVVYDLTDRHLPTVRLYNTIRNADGSFSLGQERPVISPTELDYVTMTRTDRLDRTNAYTGKLDIGHQGALFGVDTLLQFGGQYDDRTKTSDRTTLEARAADLTAAGIPLPRQGDFAINDPFKGKIPLGYAFRYFSSDQGEAMFDRFIQQGGTRTQPGAREANYFKVNERVIAGYAMATSSFDWGNVVAGVRVENVRNHSEAFADDPTKGFEPVSVSTDRTLAFPSLHVNWDINTEMKFRVSLNTGAARPDYTDLRPNFSIDDQGQLIEGGNPLAKAERAKGIDAYYEWYMPSRGYLSLGVFYKDLKDVLFEIERPQFGSDVLNVPGFDRASYRYATIDNGASGSIKGFEAAYSQPLENLARKMNLPDWAMGFGLQANLTLNDTEATTPDGRKVDLPGASDVVYNTSFYYERYGFSARVSWQYRSKWIDSIGSNPVLGDNYWDSVGRLDVSVRYAFNKNAELYIDANNLTNAPGIRFVGDRQRVIEHETFGARVLAGVRLNF